MKSMAQSGLVAKATFTYTYFTYSVFLWWPLVVQKCTFTDRPLFDKQKTRYLNLAPPHFYPIVQGIAENLLVWFSRNAFPGQRQMRGFCL